jgi:hypothetical protein
MKHQRGDVILLRMEFHQTQGGKVRPALVILDTGDDDVVAAPVTSWDSYLSMTLPSGIGEWRA